MALVGAAAAAAAAAIAAVAASWLVTSRLLVVPVVAAVVVVVIAVASSSLCLAVALSQLVARRGSILARAFELRMVRIGLGPRHALLDLARDDLGARGASGTGSAAVEGRHPLMPLLLMLLTLLRMILLRLMILLLRLILLGLLVMVSLVRRWRVGGGVNDRSGRGGRWGLISSTCTGRCANC